MKTLLLTFSILLTAVSFSHAQRDEDLSRILSSYETYKDPRIKDRRFKHREIVPIIKEAAAHPLFSLETLGNSVEGREIYHLSIGTGPVSVLMWSQMHGNEPTATMAIMDILQFFTQETDAEEWKRELLSKVTLHFVPMLNPDGAERYKRRNLQDIDINRDAQRLQTPEGRILKSIRDELDADFGFNLHDQGRAYSAGNSANTATLSFLAPAFNVEKDINPVRKNAIKLISYMCEVLDPYMGGKIGKYNDTFEPRAFGDNIQKWGTSTILIECGGYRNDREKQFIRKMNFIALMSSFHGIANKSYRKASPKVYNTLPFNQRRLFDVLIRNMTIKQHDIEYKIDMALYYQENQTNMYRDFFLEGRVAELGDLSTYYGYQEVDASNLRWAEGKMYPDAFKDVGDISPKKIQELLASGYTTVVVEEFPTEPIRPHFPLSLSLADNPKVSGMDLGYTPNFLLYEGETVKYAIVNGILYELEKGLMIGRLPDEE